MNWMGGGILAIVLIFVYVALIVLTISVLIRVVILLPVLTKLALEASDYLSAKRQAPLERRLLDLEDLHRLGRLTAEEYAAKRQAILDDL